MAPPELDERSNRILSGVRLVALDVDGTLTDGRVTYVAAPGDASSPDAPDDAPDACREQQAFDVYDGQGLAWLRRADVTVVWITGRGSAPTRRRARELGIAELHERSGPKDQVLADVQARLGIDPEHTVAMGDDLPDLAFKHRAALFAAPANARAEVLAAADLVTVARGGHGAVRELVEAILRAQGRWAEIAKPAE